MNVNLHIERLVLEGFAPADAHRIALSVEHSLKSLLSGPEAARLRDQTVDRALAAQFVLRPEASPDLVGTQIGTALFWQSLIQGGEQ